MRRASVALLLIFGCAPVPVATLPGPIRDGFDGDRASVNAFEHPVILAEWRGAVDGEFLGTPEDPAPPDPTTLLAWATPPASVGCVVRGTGAPFVEACEPDVVTVHERGLDIAQVTPSGIEMVWGIPRRSAQSLGLWVHGRSGGLSVTGHARKPMKFALRSEVMVVKDHVWAKKDAPVIPRHADDGVAIAIQDDIVGVAEVRAVAACDDLGFDVLEVPLFAAPVAAPPEEEPKPVVMNPSGSTLALFDEPGGAVLTTLRATEERPLYLEMEVKATRGASSRVSFETTHARFDVWVRTAEIAEGGGRLGFGALGCGRSTMGTRGSSATLGRSSAVHVGALSGQPKATAGLQVAAGMGFFAGERHHGLVAITPVDSAIAPVGEQLFWVPETALIAP